MTKKLDDFVGYYHLNEFKRETMLSWVTEVYQPVFPLKLEDSDLQQFLNVIYLAVQFFEPEYVVQTGTFVGTSSLAMAKSFEDNNKGMLYTIDPEPPLYFGISNPVNIARQVVELARLQNRICFIKGYSTIPNDEGRMTIVPGEFWRLKKIAHGIKYDILVIDGDHSYEGCFNDLYYGTAGFHKKGPRLIIVHDYLGIASVRNAVRSYRSYFNSSNIKIVPTPCGVALIQLN